MDGGVCVSKQIHLDEQLVAYIYISVRPFPHGVGTRASWSFALLSGIRAVGGERAGTPLFPCSYQIGKGLHAVYSAVAWGEADTCCNIGSLVLYVAFYNFILEPTGALL